MTEVSSVPTAIKTRTPSGLSNFNALLGRNGLNPRSFLNREESGMEARTTPVSLEGWRILLVEDDPLILLDLDTSLTELGAVVTATTDGTTALELVGATPLDFAVLDFELGAQTSEPIAVAAQAAGLPFLFLSGYSENDERFL